MLRPVHMQVVTWTKGNASLLHIALMIIQEMPPWGDPGLDYNNSPFAQNRTRCCGVVCWIIMNSYIVRLKKNKSIINWTTWFYFVIQIGCHMVASDILYLIIKIRKAAASSLLNRILLNRNVLCNEMQFN